MRRVLWPRPASEGDSAICGAVDNWSTKQLAGAGGGAAVRRRRHRRRFLCPRRRRGGAAAPAQAAVRARVLGIGLTHRILIPYRS